MNKISVTLVLNQPGLTKFFEQNLQCPKENGDNNVWHNMERLEESIMD